MENSAIPESVKGRLRELQTSQRKKLVKIVLKLDDDEFKHAAGAADWMELLRGQMILFGHVPHDATEDQWVTTIDSAIQKLLT